MTVFCHSMEKNKECIPFPPHQKKQLFSRLATLRSILQGKQLFRRWSWESRLKLEWNRQDERGNDLREVPDPVPIVDLSALRSTLLRHPEPPIQMPEGIQGNWWLRLDNIGSAFRTLKTRKLLSPIQTRRGPFQGLFPAPGSQWPESS